MTSPTPPHKFSDALSPSPPPPLPPPSSPIAHDTPPSGQTVPTEDQLYAFQTLRFSYQARDVDLTPPAPIATTALAPSNNANNDLYKNQNIDLTGASTLSIVQPSRATVSRSKVSYSGAEVNGTMTLAFMACQMLPDPMHLREIWAKAGELPAGTTATTPPPTRTTGIAPFPAIAALATETASEGESLRQLTESAYAIEYFEDQDCTQFLMATAGSRVNIHGAEDDSLNTHGIANSGVGAEAKTTATTVGSKSWKEKIRQSRVVSVRWIGLVSPSEFLLEKSKHIQDRVKQRHVRRDNAGPTRTAIRSVEDDDDDEDDDADDNDEDDEDDDDKVDDDDEEDPQVYDDSGYLSWEPFLPSQIYPPPRITVGTIASGPSSFVAAVLDPGFDAQEGLDPTTKHNGTQKGAASEGLDHGTSQLMMAGLVVGLLLFLGSFLMAVRYRQRRKNLYEETA